MSKNMFYIKEEDQELFDQFSPIFIDYSEHSIQYRDRYSAYYHDKWYKLSVVFFVLFTGTRGNYYRDIIRAIIDIYNGMGREEIKDKYKSSKYVLTHTIYVGKNNNSIFFKALDGFVSSIYESHNSIYNINLAKWKFPYRDFSNYVGIDKNDKNLKWHDHCTIDEFIHDINTAYVEKRPSLIKIVKDFMSYTLEYDKTEDMEDIIEEYKEVKERIKELNDKIIEEKHKLNDLESKITRIKYSSLGFDQSLDPLLEMYGQRSNKYNMK